MVMWLRNKHKFVANINKGTDDAITKLRHPRRHSYLRVSNFQSKEQYDLIRLRLLLLWAVSATVNVGG